MVQIVNPLENGVELLQSFGFFSVVLPFLLVYSLIFGLLSKTKLFGDDSTSVNQVIALSISLFVITSTDVVNLMMGVIPQAAFLLVVILMLMMMAGLLGMDLTSGIFGDKGFGLKILFPLITLIFLMIIDAGIEGGIPLIRQLNEILIGVQPFIVTGEAFSTLVGLTFVVGIPLAIIKWLK